MLSRDFLVSSLQYAKAADLARSYVDDQASIKWCPSADCCNAVRAQSGQLSVQCACKHRFCFSCMHDDHAPCSCSSLELWKIKCHDDSETYNWLVANTKARVFAAAAATATAPSQNPLTESTGMPEVCRVHREEWRLQSHDLQKSGMQV